MKRHGGYQRRPGRGSAQGRGGQVRIVAGRDGGRRLRVASAPGLRPTPEKTRETLFNWLQGALEGARVLDLFAGTGALAFEALSRGARSAVLVERHREALRLLREAAAELAPGQARVVGADALAWLRRGDGGEPFDIVFLDPPFATDLARSALRGLGEGDLLAAEALVYAEWPAAAAAPFDAGIWEAVKTTRSGDSSAALLVRRPVADATTAV